MPITRFNSDALKWMKAYLSGRSQAVYVDGSLSPFLPVKLGVPQGSILGLLCYVLFTNDLPETISEPDCLLDHRLDFNTHCSMCGGLCCFADDSTFSLAGQDLLLLEEKMNSKYSEMSAYMANSRLKLNDEKTHLLLMGTRQRLNSLQSTISIQTSGEPVKSVNSEKLLGVKIQEDLKWGKYLVKDKDSLISKLSSRLSALKLIGWAAGFKTRLMIANGIFSSKLIYMISLWGRAEGYLLDSLQKMQNRCARFVTKKDKYTPVSQLLKECGWMSVRQLIFYHSTVQIFKILRTETPTYIYQRITETGSFPYNTRLAASDSVRIAPSLTSRLEIIQKSFVIRATQGYNLLPTELRQLSSLELFKKHLKAWIRENYVLI